MAPRAAVAAALCLGVAGAVCALLASVAVPPGWEPQHALTLGLLGAAVCLPVWCCFRRTPRHLAGPDFFEPGMLLALFFYLYVVIPGFYVWSSLDYRSHWIDPQWPRERLFHATLAISLLGLVAFRIGYRSNLHALQLAELRSTLSSRAARWSPIAPAAIIVMLAVGLAFKLQHLAAIGGLSPNALLFLSPTYTSESAVRISGIAALLESFFDWGALLLLLRAVVTGRQVALSVVMTFIALGLAFLLSGKRSAVLPFLLFPLVWYHYLRHRLSFGRGLILITSGGLLMAALLLMRILGPHIVRGGLSGNEHIAELLLRPLQFYLDTPELAIFDMTMLAIQDRGPLLHEIGGPFWGGLQYNLSSVAYLIPRFLWPAKPVFSDLGQVFYQWSVGGSADVGFSVGIVGGLYLFGGVIGLLLGMFLVGIAFQWAYRILQPWNRDPVQVFLYGIFFWMAFQFLRFGTLGFTILFFIQFQLVGVLAALILFNRNRPGSAAAA